MAALNLSLDALDEKGGAYPVKGLLLSSLCAATTNFHRGANGDNIERLSPIRLQVLNR